jgi:hypothetical protein
MPIFEKDHRRIYFVHIPKNAGSAVYLLLMQNGWSVSNVDTTRGRRRIGRVLYDRFGIIDIPKQGDIYDFHGPRQHAPSGVWNRWGPFDFSFAVCRNPYTRLLSALKYECFTVRGEQDFEEYKSKRLAEVRNIIDKRPHRVPVVFMRQSKFVDVDTLIFRYEDAWVFHICKMLELKDTQSYVTNASANASVALSESDRDWARAYYAQDFSRFGYNPNECD